MSDDNTQEPNTYTGKLISLEHAKGKRKKGDKADKDPRRGPSREEIRIDMYRELLDVINRQNRHELLPPFPVKFHVYRPQNGEPLTVQEGDKGEVSIVNEAVLRSYIVRWTAGPMRQEAAYKWDVDGCRKAAQYWLTNTEPKEISMVAWKDEPGLTFSRLPWTGTEPAQPHQLFDEMFSRMSNADAVRAFIGSLFDAESDRQQYLYLYGSGGVGKSTLLRMLAKVFKGAYRSMQPPVPNETHWSSGLLGARLVAFCDLNNNRFPTSAIFKTITGGDEVLINPKFKPSYSTILPVKIILSSNRRPSLSSESADTRRAIYAEIQAPPEVGRDERATYETRLWQEMGDFLRTCVAHYENTSYRGLIATDRRELNELIEQNEEPMEAFFERHMELAPGGIVLTDDMKAALDKNKDQDFSRPDFLAYLERHYKVTSTSKYCPVQKKSVRGYRGLKMKSLRGSGFNV